MSPKKITKPVDIYVRVSKVGGREGDSFISPAVQEERCRLLAGARELTVGKVFTDLDQSGGKMERPEFEKALTRIHDGVSAGIIVARIDRFSRTLLGGLETLKTIDDAGGVVLTAEGDYDSSSATGELVLNLMLTLAQFELRRIKENWAAAHKSMITRGVQSGRVPIGYTKNGDKRLVPSEYAPFIQEAFRLRAEEGINWHALARWLTEQGVPTQKGGAWLPAAARKMIENPTYLGQVRYGGSVNEEAHEPLVDERTFRLANRKQKRVSGVRGDGPLLGAGVLRCVTCGRGLYLTTNGKGNSYYRCQTPGPGHPTIAKDAVEHYLIQATLERLELAEGEYVEATVDPALQLQLENVLGEIEELDRQLEAGEITPTIYSKAASVAERDKDAIQEQIDTQLSTGVVALVGRTAKSDRDAVRHLLLTLVDPDVAEHAASVDPGQIPAARTLIRDTLGEITVDKGRGSPEKRVVIEQR